MSLMSWTLQRFLVRLDLVVDHRNRSGADRAGTPSTGRTSSVSRRGPQEGRGPRAVHQGHDLPPLQEARPDPAVANVIRSKSRLKGFARWQALTGERRRGTVRSNPPPSRHTRPALGCSRETGHACLAGLSPKSSQLSRRKSVMVLSGSIGSRLSRTLTRIMMLWNNRSSSMLH